MDVEIGDQNTRHRGPHAALLLEPTVNRDWFERFAEQPETLLLLLLQLEIGVGDHERSKVGDDVVADKPMFLRQRPALGHALGQLLIRGI